jgi:peptidoglycan/LPS O-acetylase OafA/YrhL
MTSTESPQPTTSRRILRRIGAVLAGLVLIIILDNGLDVIMHATGIYPPWFQPMATGLWLLALGYRTIDSIAGSYLTARLAPDRPLAHALFLGCLGVLFSSVGVIATWNKGPEFGPKWYPIALAILAIPCSLIGGTLRQRQLR